MQAAIDSAKRTFLVDISSEIKRLKTALDVKHNGYPQFWTVIRQGFDSEKINPSLTCPMNQVYDMSIPTIRSPEPTLPMDRFFVSYDLDVSKKLSKKVEEFIEKYCTDMYNSVMDGDDDGSILLREDFDELVQSIRECTLPQKYIGLMSWLINRAFIISPTMKSNKGKLSSKLSKNKAALLRVLYEVNPESLLRIFAGNLAGFEHNC